MKWSLSRCLGVLLVFACVSFALAASEEEQGEKGKGKGKDKAKNTPNIVQVDVSKLPPGIAQYVLDQAVPSKEDKGKKKGEFAKADGKKKGKKGEGKKGGKAISLVDAIGIAEKSGYGTAVKAERKGDAGDYHFKIDLMSGDGAKKKIQLDTKGRLMEGDQKKKGDDKKGKGKGKGNKDEKD